LQRRPAWRSRGIVDGRQSAQDIPDYLNPAAMLGLPIALQQVNDLFDLAYLSFILAI
jgi:hypothetical protein